MYTLNKSKFKVKKFGDIVYIEDDIDIFYIERSQNKKGENIFIVYHQNKKFNKQNYHKHNKIFAKYEDALDYCVNHKRQYFKIEEIRKINQIDRILNNIKREVAI